VNGAPARNRMLAAWAVLIVGCAGALVTAGALHRADPSEPNGLVGALVFIPYIAGGMLLQITRRARLVVIALLLPALLDLSFGAWFNLVDPPGWDAAITWRAVRALTAVLLLPLALAVGLWMEKADARERTPS
jgi:hypothetical protein